MGGAGGIRRPHRFAEPFLRPWQLSWSRRHPRLPTPCQPLRLGGGFTKPEPVASAPAWPPAGPHLSPESPPTPAPSARRPLGQVKPSATPGSSETASGAATALRRSHIVREKELLEAGAGPPVAADPGATPRWPPAPWWPFEESQRLLMEAANSRRTLCIEAFARRQPGLEQRGRNDAFSTNCLNGADGPPG